MSDLRIVWCIQADFLVDSLRLAYLFYVFFEASSVQACTPLCELYLRSQLAESHRPFI